MLDPYKVRGNVGGGRCWTPTKCSPHPESFKNPWEIHQSLTWKSSSSREAGKKWHNAAIVHGCNYPNSHPESIKYCFYHITIPRDEQTKLRSATNHRRLCLHPNVHCGKFCTREEIHETYDFDPFWTPPHPMPRHTGIHALGSIIATPPTPLPRSHNLCYTVTPCLDSR